MRATSSSITRASATEKHSAPDSIQQAVRKTASLSTGYVPRKMQLASVEQPFGRGNLALALFGCAVYLAFMVLGNLFSFAGAQ